MQRITVTVDDELKEQFDAFMRRRSYHNRSEAFRDLLRDRIEQDRFEASSAPTCIGCLTYVFGHAERDLPRRLVQAQHDHHDVSVSTLHCHLDHENCMEAVFVRGRTEDVNAFAASVTSQRGVRHGHLWLVPVALETGGHTHNDGDVGPHVHSRPTT
jgi:CopG family nickel-responsive transcriptional regulator